MKYVSLIIAVLIIELFIIIGCFIARWKNKNNVDVDHRRKIEDITLLIFWMSLFTIVVIMTGILLKNNVSKGEKDVSKRFIRTDKRKYSD